MPVGDLSAFNISRHGWFTVYSFSKAVADYINYYNNERIQVKTKWMPPSKYREASMCV